MQIKDFLEQFVEGYLFKDLENLSIIKLEQGEKYGAAGYPMLISICAGIELLGIVVSEETFDHGEDFIYFDKFWNTLVELNPKYGGLGRLVYKLARNGLAHTFVTKIGILVTKDSNQHLKLDLNERILILDVNQLYSDLKTAYTRQVKPLLESEKSVLMQRQLDALIDYYEAQSKSEFDKFARENPGRQILSNVIEQITSSGISSAASGTSMLSGNFPRPEFTRVEDDQLKNSQ